jgi:alpha-1,6-mannosyltransferase
VTTATPTSVTESPDAEAIGFYSLAAVGATLAALVVVTPFAFRLGGDNLYIALMVVAGLLAICATRLAERVSPTRALWLIVGLAVGLRAFLLAFDPLLSDDIYRYVWDGRVQAAGINPYRYVPADEALTSLRDDAIYPRINRHDYAPTIYPPVAQFFFALVTRLGESVTVMRIGLLGCEAAAVVAIMLLLRRLRKPLTRIVAYLWHPLPMWEIANSGHVDALMVALMMLGIWLAIAGWPLRGAVAVALAALAKPFAALALPTLWRPWDWRMPGLVLAVWALCYLPYLSVGWGVLGFLAAGYLNEEGFVTGDRIWPLAAWRTLFGTHDGDVLAYFALVAFIIAGLALAASFRKEHSSEVILGDVARILLSVLFLVSPNYPWYFLAITPFVALCGGAPLWTASIGALLLQNEVDWDHYISVLVRKTVLYGAFLVALAYSLWSMWRRRSVGEA